MKFIVGLNIKSRYFRPAIGEFQHTERHQRHVWRGEETGDIDRLAGLTNEALEFIRKMDQVDLVLGIYPVVEAAVIDRPSTPEAMPRRRRLLTT